MSLSLDIDSKRLGEIANEFQASEKDLRRAYDRALSRTAQQLRTQARRSLAKGLKLRAQSVFKARIALRRFKGSGRNLKAAKLWVGKNNVPPGWLKGKPRSTARGVRVGGHELDGAFIGTSKTSRKQMVFRRIGDERTPIERETIFAAEDMEEILDRQVFEMTSKIFFQNFRAEVRARTIYGVGK